MEIEPQMVHWFGLELDLKMVIMTWLVMAIIFVIAWFARRDLSWIPKGWQNVIEYMIEFVQGIIKTGWFNINGQEYYRLQEMQILLYNMGSQISIWLQAFWRKIKTDAFRNSFSVIRFSV